MTSAHSARPFSRTQFVHEFPQCDFILRNIGEPGLVTLEEASVLAPASGMIVKYVGWRGCGENARRLVQGMTKLDWDWLRQVLLQLGNNETQLFRRLLTVRNDWSKK